MVSHRTKLLFTSIVLLIGCRTSDGTQSSLAAIDQNTGLRDEDVIAYRLVMDCQNKTSQYVAFEMELNTLTPVQTQVVDYFYPRRTWNAASKTYRYEYQSYIAASDIIAKKRRLAGIRFTLVKDNYLRNIPIQISRVPLPANPQKPFAFGDAEKNAVKAAIHASAEFSKCQVSLIEVGLKVDPVTRGNTSATLQDLDLLKVMMLEQQSSLDQISAEIQRSQAEQKETAALKAKVLLLESQIKLLKEKILVLESQ